MSSETTKGDRYSRDYPSLWERSLAKGERVRGLSRRFLRKVLPGYSPFNICLIAAILSAPSIAYGDGRSTPPDPIGAASQIVRFGDVAVRWNRELTPALRARFESSVATTFSGIHTEAGFDAAMHTLLYTLEAAGYRQARLAPRDFALHDGSLDFALYISPGPRSRVVAVEFHGLVRTDTAWLSRQVTQPFDVPLTSEWLARADRQLRRLANVRTESDPEIVVLGHNPQANEMPVMVRWHMRERRATRFDGLLAAGGGASENELTGRASLHFDGLFGRDRSAVLQYHRPRPGWRTLDVALAERGAFGQPFDWSLELTESRQLDRRQRLAASVGYIIPCPAGTAPWKAELGGSWHRITPGASRTPPVRVVEGFLGVEKPAPASVHRYTMRLRSHFGLWTTYSHRRQFSLLGKVDTEDVSDRLRLNTETDLTYYFARRWELGLAAAARWWAIGRDRLGHGDEWYLGGVDYLRGYEDRTIAAASGVWTAIELGHWLRPSFGVSLFGETARLSDIESGVHFGEYRQLYGYGWALRLISADRVGRLEFAWRPEAAWRDGIVRLRISQSW